MELKRVQRIPSTLKPKAVELAVKEFITETSVKADPIGMFNQTLEKILAATELGVPGHDFWLYEKDGEVKAYLLAHVAKEVDNRLTYWIEQAWESPEIRNQEFTKECWASMKQRAQQLYCAHIVMVTNREQKAWEKLLQDGIHYYGALLKRDLEE